MISIEAFADELEKIAACKGRTGKVPIRAGKLANKSSVDKSRSQLKTAAKSSKTLQRAGLIGGGIVGWEAGKAQLRDWKTGRRYRKQMEAQAKAQRRY